MHVLPGPARNLVFVFVFFFFWLTSVEWGKIRLPANKVQVQLLKCSCCHQTLLLTPVIVRAGWHKPITLRCPEGPGWLSGLLQALHKQFGSSSCRLSDGLFWDRALSTLLLHPSVELYLPFEFYHFIRSFIKWTSYFLFNVSSLLLPLLIWI